MVSVSPSPSWELGRFASCTSTGFRVPCVESDGLDAARVLVSDVTLDCSGESDAIACEFAHRNGVRLACDDSGCWVDHADAFLIPPAWMSHSVVERPSVDGSPSASVSSGGPVGSAAASPVVSVSGRAGGPSSPGVTVSATSPQSPTAGSDSQLAAISDSLDLVLVALLFVVFGSGFSVARGFRHG